MSGHVTPRKVLVVTSWYPSPRIPNDGGFVKTQVRVLTRRYDVAVIAPDLRSLRTIVQHGFGPRQMGVQQEDGVPIVRPRVLSPFPKRPSVVVDSYARMVRRAFELLERAWGRPDVIHAQIVLNAGYSAARLGRQLGVPVILTEHASEANVWLKTLWRRDLMRRTLESIPFHVAVSPSLADRIRRIAPVDVRVIGNVIDTEFFAPSPGSRTSGPVRLAFLSRLIPAKGAEILVRAVHRMNEAGITDWVLRIGGAGSRAAALGGLTRELFPQGKVELLGALDPTGVRELFAWSDFVVLPSRHETFGVAAAEAMAMGNPVIGFTNPGFEYVVGSGCGTLVAPGDIDALSRAIADAVTGRVQFDRSAIRRSIVTRFGPESFLDAISALYEEALAQSGR